MTEKTLGLYLHFPFCASKCPYCDFYSRTEEADYARYADALLLHMEDYSSSTEHYDVDTVFFGGGTPTVMPMKNLLSVIDGMYDSFVIRDDAEFTVEANPATVSAKDLKSLRKAGVNRLSMGLQSANDNELKKLGRIHTFEDFKQTYKDARAAGFKNINADLMYGIPEQTEESLMESLKRLCDLEPEHISLYGLRIEDGTPYAKMKDKLALPDEDGECEMYFKALEFLNKNGWAQYEISNFSKPGKQCLHNLRYWRCEEYLGFGPGAHSYFGQRRFAYKRDTDAYIKNLEFPGSIPDILSENYSIKPSERLGEYVMLQMRLTSGVNSDEFMTRFGVSFEKMFGKYLALYIKNGFMKTNGRSYCFTPKGMFVSNYILSAMLDFDSDIISGVADGSDK